MWGRVKKSSVVENVKILKNFNIYKEKSQKSPLNSSLLCNTINFTEETLKAQNTTTIKIIQNYCFKQRLDKEGKSQVFIKNSSLKWHINLRKKMKNENKKSIRVRLKCFARFFNSINNFYDTLRTLQWVANVYMYL